MQGSLNRYEKKRKRRTEHQNKNFVLAVKHGGGCIACNYCRNTESKLIKKFLQENDAHESSSRTVLFIFLRKLLTLPGKIFPYSFCFSGVVIFNEMATRWSLKKIKKGLLLVPKPP